MNDLWRQVLGRANKGVASIGGELCTVGDVTSETRSTRRRAFHPYGADRAGTLAVGEMSSETEIDQNDVTLRRYQDILGLQVAINDSRRVQAADAFDDLCGVETSTIASESAPPS